MEQREEVLDRALTDALDRLPRYPAPWALRRRLAARWPTVPAPRPRRLGRWALGVVPALGVAVALLLVFSSVKEREHVAAVRAGLITEAVNDHIRLAGRSALDIEASSLHTVRPWFTGRLDFAPVVPFAGNVDLALRGGAVERFLDRNAAAFVYQRRLHTVTLFVLRAEGRGWPNGEPSVTTSRGFSVVLWRTGELGYALVSDISTTELRALADRFRATPSTSG